MNRYYLFSFLKYSGDDRIFVFETEKKLGVGDLIQTQTDVFLNLGQEISRKEKYNFKISFEDIDILQTKLLGQDTIKLINFLVYQYYSTYKKIINLFLEDDFRMLFKYKISKVKKPQFNKALIDYENSSLELTDQKQKGQQLVIFPDLFTLKNYFGGKAEILHSGSTTATKTKFFRKIKSGEISTLFCTYSQIFQDWQNLKKICIIDSHKRYYKSQQDPRYYTITTVRKMAEIYGADLEEYGFLLGN